MKKTFLFAAALLAVTGAPAVSQDVAASSTKLSKSFDGKWSVLIVTEQGQCDRAYRYPLVIENGYVGYGGRNNFTVTGEVYNGGDVVVTVAQGNYSAQGTGRLQGKYGSGKWAAPAGDCSGRWKADKRG